MNHKNHSSPVTSTNSPSPKTPLRVAIVHDWLTNMGGAEPLVLELHKLYPDAPIYTSVYDKQRMAAFADCDVRTTYLQKVLPKFLRYKHILWPVLRAHAFRKLDMSAYDLIISSSTAESKSVKKKPGAIHICYCNTPTRYYWSHYNEFKSSFHFGPLNFLIKPLIPFFVWWMRKLDLKAAAGVDLFIANSNEVKRRIKKYYGRDSTVIFPGVDTGRFAQIPSSKAQNPSTQYPSPNPQPRSGYITWGRHVPYKKIDLAIEACNLLEDQLTVIGSGPETERLKQIAGPTITFPGRVSDDELVKLAHKSKAFIFPGDEDFGISPVEAIASGLPVIAYKSGGALDYVIEGKTGTFFSTQTVPALAKAINNFDYKNYSPSELQNFAESFSNSRFRQEIREFVDHKLGSRD